MQFKNLVKCLDKTSSTIYSENQEKGNHKITQNFKFCNLWFYSLRNQSSSLYQDVSRLFSHHHYSTVGICSCPCPSFHVIFPLSLSLSPVLKAFCPLPQRSWNCGRGCKICQLRCVAHHPRSPTFSKATPRFSHGLISKEFQGHQLRRLQL